MTLVWLIYLALGGEFRNAARNVLRHLYNGYLYVFRLI